MELSTEIDVQLAKGLTGAKLSVQLMYVFIYRGQITAGVDVFTGLCDIGLGCCVRTRLVSKLRINVTLHQSPSSSYMSPLCWVGPPVCFDIGYTHGGKRSKLTLPLAGRCRLRFELRKDSAA